MIYVGAVVILGFHLRHALWSVLQTHGFDKPNRNPTFRRGATATAVLITVGFAAVPIAFLTGILPAPDAVDETIERYPPDEPDPRREGPRGADRSEVAHLARRPQAGRPAQPLRLQGDRRRHRPRRRQRRRDPGRHGLQGQGLLLPGLGPPGALDRRPGRDQRDQGLRQRGRLRSTACSSTRSRAATSAPARRTSGGWPSSRPRSSTRPSPRACPSTASTAACSRPAASAACWSSAPSTAAARPASSSCSAPTSRCRSRSPTATRRVNARHEMLDLVIVDGRARGIIARDLVSGEITAPRRRRRGARHRRLLQRLLPLDQRDGLQRDRDLARPQARRRLRQPLLHPDPPDLHPAVGRLPVEADADERVAAQRRPDLGAQGPRARSASPPRSPRTSATTTSRSATRGSATWCRVTSPRGRRRSSATTASGSAQTGRGVYLDFRDAIRDKGDDDDRRPLREPLRACTSGSPARAPGRRR